MILPVSQGRAFEVLEDPRSLRVLVLGARRIRRFDPDWPDPGSVVHHSVGLFPFLVRDTTIVRACEPPHRLVLEARVQAVGVFTVTFDLTGHGDGTRLAIGEEVTGGFLSLPPIRPLSEAVVMLRNRVLARRYKRLVDRREDAAVAERHA